MTVLSSGTARPNLSALGPGLLAAAAVFHEMEWKWVDRARIRTADAGLHVPDVEEIAAAITRNIHSAHADALASRYEKDTGYSSSGRFRIEVFVNNEDGDLDCAEVYLHIGTVPLQPTHDDTEVSHGH